MFSFSFCVCVVFLPFLDDLHQNINYVLSNCLLEQDMADISMMPVNAAASVGTGGHLHLNRETTPCTHLDPMWANTAIAQFIDSAKQWLNASSVLAQF